MLRLPKRVSFDGMTAAGIAVRTSNAMENRPETARIRGLWQRFAQERLPERLADVRGGTDPMAVYFDYQSDHDGPYSVLVGLPVSNEATLPDIDLASPSATRIAELEADIAPLPQTSRISCILIEPGDYLVFEAGGPMPDALIECWRGIWKYFNGSREERAFLTDVEFHKNGKVEIYVGIRD